MKKKYVTKEVSEMVINIAVIKILKVIFLLASITLISKVYAQPIISNEAVAAQETSATLSWLTDEASVAEIAYGLTNAYELGTLLESTSSTATVDFEEIVVPLNSDIDALDFTSAGYSFDILDDHSNFTHGERFTSLGDPYSYNGATYFYIHGYYNAGWVKPEVTISSSSGSLFTLQSVDIAEVVLSIGAETVEVRGAFADGSETITTLVLDGITDGTGIENDFQTIAFDNTWTGLTRVTFTAITGNKYAMFALDNLVLTEEAALVTDHSFILDNLTPDTPYFAQITAYDIDGNASDPVPLTFNTLAAGLFTPPIISNTVITAGETTATVTWTTDELATSSLDYGETNLYEIATIGNGTNLSTSHSLDLTGLLPSTLYYIQLTSVDSDGNSTVAGDLTFTTDASGSSVPPIISNEAVVAQETSASLSWLTDEASTAEIAYGLTNAYELGTLFESSSSTVTVDFEEIVVPLNSDIDALDFTSAGYSFDILDDHSNFTNGERFTSQGNPYSYNGGTYFYVHGYYNSGWVKPEVTLSTSSGALFSLQSVDIAEVVLSIGAETVEVRGTYADGGEVVTTIVLDGITDGTGIENDFQTIAFDNTWTGLSSVTFSAITGNQYTMFALDNLVLVEEPELFTDHSFVLDNLTPDTPYFAQITAFDTDGNASNPVSLTFSTVFQGSLVPPVISSVIADPTETSINLSWLTDEPAVANISYGLTNGYELGTVSESNNSATTIDLEEITVPVNTDSGAGDFNSAGYLFDISNNNVNFVNGEVFFNTEPYSYNNSTYFYVAGVFNNGWVYPSITVTPTSGALFTLQSLDIGEIVISLAADEIQVVGTYADGSQVVTTIVPDGITDGVGGNADFQTITFDSSWTGLSNLTFQAINSSNTAVFGLDNIVIIEDPEYTLNHNFSINGLTPDTEYFIQIIALDPEGNPSVPATLSVNTLTAGTLTAPAISNVTTIPGETNATLTWITDEPSHAQIDFGTTTAYELGSIAESVEITRTIDFQDIAGVPQDDDIDLADFTSGGYFFDLSHDHSNFAKGELFFLNEPVSYNGADSIFFFVHNPPFNNGWTYPTTTMSSSNGSLFDLKQLDISESTLLAEAFDVEITGQYADGSTISIVHVLDTILDGNDADGDGVDADDYETLVFDEAWSNLVSVTFQALSGEKEAEFALDNIIVTEPPAVSTNHSISLTNLTQDTEYHGQIIATDPEGNNSTPVNFTFTTLPQGTLEPTVISNTIIVPQLNSALLSWQTDKLSTAEIAYGLTAQYELGTVFESQNTTLTSVIDFENIVVSLDSEIDASDFSSGRFFFDISDDHSNFANGELFAGSEPYSFNGSTYFFIHGIFDSILNDFIYPSVEITSTTNAIFTLSSLDIAEVVLSVGASIVEVRGTLEDGSEVVNTITLNGINDGNIGSPDFQTISFDASWTRLTSVNIRALSGADQATFALDNIVVIEHALSHGVELTSLSPDATYYVQIIAHDIDGNLSTPVSLTFDTLDPFSPIITDITLSLTESTIIDWVTDELAFSSLAYGLTTSYELGTIDNTSLSLTHSATLPGLAPNTQYHFKLTAADIFGNTAVTEDQTFITSDSIDNQSPEISKVTVETNDSTATISWITNERSTSEINYGLTDLYGNILTDIASGGPETIDFEDIIVADGTDIDAGDFTSKGYTFDISSDHSNFANGELFFLNEPVSYNGTTYFFVHAEPDTSGTGFVYPTTTMTSESGSLFSLIQLDISDATLLANAYSIEITGQYADGSTVSIIHNLDGILDGTGSENDFETVVFDNAWTDLVSVTFQALDGLREAEFVLDNIVVDSSGRSVKHRLIIPGLDPDTTYHYQITSTDESGNPSSTPDLVFTTLALGQQPVEQQLFAGAMNFPFSSIDSATGISQVISTSDFGILGMGYDPFAKALYVSGQEIATGAFKLATIEPTSGYISLIGSTNLNGSNKSIDGLAFDSRANILYGMEINANGYTNLYTINPDTAELTAVGIDSTIPFQEAFGLAFDYDTDQLYGLGTHVSGGIRLVTIDRASASHTIVGEDLSISSAEALAFHAADGVFYSVNNNTGELISINPTNALTTTIGNTGANTIDGMISLSWSSADPSVLLAYNFEGVSGNSVSDVSGNGNTGILENGAITDLATDTRFGTVLDVAPPSGNVNLGPVDIEGSELTISLWMNANSFAIKDARLFSKAVGTAENDHYYMLSTYSGSRVLRFRLKTTEGGTSTLISNGILTTNQWIHVAVTYDGAEMRIYQDGILVGSLAKSGNLVTAPSVDTWLGDNPTGVKTFDGQLDELRIYNRALSVSEIQDEMSRVLGN
jgi:hypothetical protein